MRTIAAAGLLAVFLGGPAAAEYGDAGAGLALAQRWCAACHVVADDQLATDQVGAPAFRALSATPASTETGLLNAVGKPHPRMPEIDLSRQQAADLAAYIATFAGN